MKRSKSEIDAFLNARAEEMRRYPTEAEAALWERLRLIEFWKQQIDIYGQTKNGHEWAYILDFYDPVNKLCVEVDGLVHKRQRGRDRRRDTRLATIGIRTIRFTNREVLTDIDGVLAKIRAALESRTD
jgi:very-short-patch-repair endonuclease